MRNAHPVASLPLHSRAKTSHRRPRILCRMTDYDITGRIGGLQGLEVRARLEDDTVKGRVGGAFGKEFDLTLTDTGVQGQVGGKTGFAISLELRQGELMGQLGSEDFSLRGVDHVTGRIGSSLVGLSFDTQQVGEKLIGAIGNRDVTLNLGSSPGWIGAMVAAIAVYALERHR